VNLGLEACPYPLQRSGGPLGAAGLIGHHTSGQSLSSKRLL